MQRATSLIERVCDIAAPRNYLAETREYLVNAGIVAAVANHDTPALFRWLMEIISHQGIADRIARDYLDRHGRVQWADVEEGLRRPDPCPKLATYWTLRLRLPQIGTSCAVPRLPHCIVPIAHAPLAVSPSRPWRCLFLRDVCGARLYQLDR
jgi:hypothetical protein